MAKEKTMESLKVAPETAADGPTAVPAPVVESPQQQTLTVEDTHSAASYANFYIANTIVLVPTYAQASDATALQVLEQCFPGRRVIGVDSREFIWGFGSIHCSTQQIPA